MCGIAGWYSNQPHPYPPETLERMLDRLRHRGPNAGGTFFDEGLALGHRRLSIIDIEGGAQPFFSADRRYCLSFNGQIYNYLEIRERLQKKGIVFRTSSDTEVLLALLIDGGYEALNQTNGMFAFALWDSLEKRLLLARDRFGVKPLYLCKGPRVISFASELKALLLLPDFQMEIDQSAVIDYLALGYIRAPRSIFSSVSKILPGQAVVITAEGCEHHQWYERSALVTGTTDHRAQPEQIRDLLEDSIRLRQRSDVPLGSLLSGGIDSGAVTAIAASTRADPMQTFTVGFGGALDELPYANLLADRYQTKHRELMVGFDQALANLPRLAWHLDEPHGDTAALPTYAVSELSARHVTVVLTGIGGDELFGGYTRYYDGTRLEHLYRKFPPLLRKGLLQPMLGIVSPTAGYRARMNDQPDLMRHLWHSGVFVGEALDMLMGKPTSPETFRVPPGLCHPGDVQNNFMAADLDAYLPDDILSLTDRMSMAVSLEAREPLLDHRLVELCYQIPSHQKLDPLARKTKLVLRKAIEDLLPQPLLNLKKQGFGSPISEWLSSVQAPVMRLLASGRLATSGLICKRGLTRYLENGASYDGVQRALRIWTLLMLELWLRIFVDGAGEAPDFTLNELLD